MCPPAFSPNLHLGDGQTIIYTITFQLTLRCAKKGFGDGGKAAGYCPLPKGSLQFVPVLVAISITSFFWFFYRESHSLLQREKDTLQARCLELESSLQHEQEEMGHQLAEQQQVSQYWRNRWEQVTSALKTKEEELEKMCLQQRQALSAKVGGNKSPARSGQGRSILCHSGAKQIRPGGHKSSSPSLPPATAIQRHGGAI